MVVTGTAGIVAERSGCPVSRYTSDPFTVSISSSRLTSESTTATSAVNPQTATYAVLAADFSNGKTITVASGTFTITLVASGSQPTNGQFINIINYGSGVITIARNGQNLNGGTTSLSLPAASATAPIAARIISDGTNYFASLTGTGTVPYTQTITAQTSVSIAPLQRPRNRRHSRLLRQFQPGGGRPV